MMPSIFKYAECNSRPPEVQSLRDGYLRVARNVESVERDGETIWTCEMAVMTTVEYAAYIGAREIAHKREQEIADETILALIEEGSI